MPAKVKLSLEIIEINLTPNRSDCLSVRGVARDLAAAGLGTLKELKINKIKGDFVSDLKWLRKFDKEEDHLCSGVSGRLFKNIKGYTVTTFGVDKDLNASGKNFADCFFA